MIYRKLTNRKFKPLINSLILLLVTSLNACMTVETKYYTPDEFRTTEDPENLDIKKIYTNNDSTVTIPDSKDITYHKNYKELGDIFIINSIDSILKKNTSANPYVLKSTNTIMKLKDIRSLRTDKTKVDVVPTILFATGIVAVIAIISMILTYHRADDIPIHIKFE
jgi:hypothetical protein